MIVGCFFPQSEKKSVSVFEEGFYSKIHSLILSHHGFMNPITIGLSVATCVSLDMFLVLAHPDFRMNNPCQVVGMKENCVLSK